MAMVTLGASGTNTRLTMSWPVSRLPLCSWARRPRSSTSTFMKVVGSRSICRRASVLLAARIRSGSTATSTGTWKRLLAVSNSRLRSTTSPTLMPNSSTGAPTAKPRTDSSNSSSQWVRTV